jgi:hypothetical protein
MLGVLVFVMPCVITLNVIMVSVVAPIRQMEGQTYEQIYGHQGGQIDRQAKDKIRQTDAQTGRPTNGF